MALDLPPKTRSILGSTDHATVRPPTERPRVLCVDDEESVLRMIRVVLSRRFDVTPVLGSMAALDAVRTANAPFAVIVSDLRMPELTGIGLLQCVRQLSPTTVRLLFTGNADVESAIAAINASEVFRLLTKPCDPVQLLAAVEAGCAEHVRLVGITASA